MVSPAGWLPRSRISSGSLRSVVKYRLLLPFFTLYCVDVCAEGLALTPSTSPSLSSSQFDESELMQQWFDVVHEKNVLAGYESELVIQSVVTVLWLLWLSVLVIRVIVYVEASPVVACTATSA